MERFSPLSAFTPPLVSLLWGLPRCCPLRWGGISGGGDLFTCLPHPVEHEVLEGRGKFPLVHLICGPGPKGRMAGPRSPSRTDERLCPSEGWSDCSSLTAAVHAGTCCLLSTSALPMMDFNMAQEVNRCGSQVCLLF